MAFSSDVEAIVAQIEIYDQIWYVRHMPTDDSQKHSEEAVELVREFIHVFENIPDGCAECFSFDLIDRLQAEYIVVEG